MASRCGEDAAKNVAVEMSPGHVLSGEDQNIDMASQCGEDAAKNVAIEKSPGQAREHAGNQSSSSELGSPGHRQSHQAESTVQIIDMAVTPSRDAAKTDVAKKRKMQSTTERDTDCINSSMNKKIQSTSASDTHTEGQGANVGGKSSLENVEVERVESPILAEMFLNCSKEGYKDHSQDLNSGQVQLKHVLESNEWNQSSVEGSSHLPPNIFDVEQYEVVNLPKTPVPARPMKLRIWPLRQKGEPLAHDDIKQETTEGGSKQTLVKDVEHIGIGRLQAPVTSTEAQSKEVSSLISSSADKMLLEDESFPFIKCSSVWNAVESLEVFHIMPQKLHFRPLEQFDMEFREGIAIGSMVTFASIVKKVVKTKLDDPLSILQEWSMALEKLNAYGFNIQPIQARLETLIRIKDEQAKLNDELMEVEEQISKKHVAEINKEKELDELSKQEDERVAGMYQPAE